MYTLFGSKGSGSASTEAALTVAGIEFRIVDASSWDSGPGLDELTRVNPLAQIPTLLLPDGSVLTESAAILIHLGLTHPASGLLPADASARVSHGRIRLDEGEWRRASQPRALPEPDVNLSIHPAPIIRPLTPWPSGRTGLDCAAEANATIPRPPTCAPGTVCTCETPIAR